MLATQGETEVKKKSLIKFVKKLHSIILRNYTMTQTSETELKSILTNTLNKMEEDGIVHLIKMDNGFISEVMTPKEYRKHMRKSE